MSTMLLAGQQSGIVLSAGAYHASGSVSLAPTPGNYTVTANFTDGSAGDTTTRETASGDTQTEVIVVAAEVKIAAWAQTKKYKETLSQTFFYWDGSAWQSLTDDNPNPWTAHPAYSDESRTATFTGAPFATAFRCVTTETDTSAGNMSTSDSRVS